MSTLFTALLVGLVAGILEWDIYGWGHTQISRPLVVGPIIGLVLGDLQMGLLIGASIEFIYLGVIPVGAAIPPDATTATSIATALGILSGIDTEVAVTLAIPVATAAQLLQIFIWTINAGLMHKADRLVEQGNIKGITKLQLTGSFMFFLQGFIPVFLAVLLGVDAVNGLVEILTVQAPMVMDGFKIAGGILPALGFAMLFVMMSNKKLIPYFIIGFTFAAFFGGTLIAVAALGLGAALLHVNGMNNAAKKSKA